MTGEELLTVAHLNTFRDELMQQLAQMDKKLSGSPVKKWLKTNDVRKILGLSPGKLSTLRINGTLPYTKLGAVIYYDADDIDKMIENNKRRL